MSDTTNLTVLKIESLVNWIVIHDKVDMNRLKNQLETARLDSMVDGLNGTHTSASIDYEFTVSTDACVRTSRCYVQIILIEPGDSKGIWHFSGFILREMQAIEGVYVEGDDEGGLMYPPRHKQP